MSDALIQDLLSPDWWAIKLSALLSNAVAWFSDNWLAFLGVIAALLTVKATFRTAQATFSTVEEMKKQRAESLTPFLEFVVPQNVQYNYSRKGNERHLGLFSIDHAQDDYDYYTHALRSFEIVNLSAGLARQIVVEWKILEPSIDSILKNSRTMIELDAKYNEESSSLYYYYKPKIGSFAGHEVAMPDKGFGWVVSESSKTQVDFCLPYGNSGHRFFIELPDCVEDYFRICSLYACEKKDFFKSMSDYRRQPFPTNLAEFKRNLERPAAPEDCSAVTICRVRVTLTYSSLDGRKATSSFYIYLNGFCRSFPESTDGVMQMGYTWRELSRVFGRLTDCLVPSE
jgi:hypothetical protein